MNKSNNNRRTIPAPTPAVGGAGGIVVGEETRVLLGVEGVGGWVVFMSACWTCSSWG